MILSYGNIVNNGLVYIDNESMYYSNITSDDGKLYRRNLKSNKKTKLSDIHDVKYITKYNESIYYTSTTNIYKLNPNTLYNEIIFSGCEDYGWVDDMSIVNDEMFFSLGPTYKMNLKTLELSEIVDNTFGVNVYNDKMYYSLNEGNGLYELDLNTNKSVKLSDSNTSCPIVQDNFLYYLDIYKKSFFKINLSNYKKEKLTNLDKDLIIFNIFKNYIFYKDDYLFRIDIENNEIKKINDFNCNDILVFEDKVFFVSYEKHEFKLYKMNFNGDNLVLID